jgi:tetratricopeptide (TPR) repeat protein
VLKGKQQHVKTFHPIIFIAAFLSLVGCATNLHSSSDAIKADYKQGELNGETVFDILSAEIAGNQDNYDYSFNKYLKQAKLTKDPGIAKRAVRIAQHLRNTKKLLEAVTLWTEVSPKAAEAQQLLASILLSQGHFDEAQPHFNSALELGEKKVLLLLTTQLHKMRDQDVISYINLLKESKGDNQFNSEKLVTIGILQERLDDHKNALISFNDALKINTDLPAALYQKAETLKSLERYQESLETLQVLLKGTSEDRQYNALEIQLLFLLDRDQLALGKIDELVAKNPNDRPLRKYLALTALDFEHLDKSKRLFQSLLDSSSKTSSPHFYLGIINERQENIEAAIDHYLKVRDGNNMLQAHTRSVSLHKQASDKITVQAITQQLIENARRKSDTTTYVLMLADWLNKFDFSTDAIELLNKHIKDQPENTDYLYARATYYEPTDFPAAEIDFKKVLSLTPDNPVVLNALGYTLTVHTQRYQEAFELIERALSLAPKDPATIDSMGWVLFKLKRYQEAVEYLTQAYNLYDDPEVASHLIAALAGNNQLKEANKILDKISQSHPNNEFVEQAKKSLESFQ